MLSSSLKKEMPTNTASNSPKLARRSWVSSMVVFFHVKPISPEELQDALRRADATMARVDETAAASEKSLRESKELHHEIDRALKESARLHATSNKSWG